MAEVFNMQGQLVFNKYFFDYECDLDLQLPAGVYLIKVTSDDIVFTKLIIIEK